jgi:hypothetical protein
MTTTQNIQKNKFNQDAYQSRWGFHACDYQTFLKIKKLYGFYWKALRRNGEWNRWNRKEPQNRILRKWYRNAQGQKTGYEIVGPKPEPKLYPVFGALNYVLQGDHALKAMGVVDAYLTARHPYPTAEEVPQLGLTIEQINNMLAHLEEFEAQ